MTEWMGDLRASASGLRKDPGLVATVVLTVAIGIGATTAIFSVADPLLRRSLPVADPQDLVSFQTVEAQSSEATSVIPYSLFERIRESPFYSGVFAAESDELWQRLLLNETGRGDPVWAAPVSGAYFQTLGLQPVLGRFFSEADDLTGMDPVAVISYRFWQRRYGGAPNVIGTAVGLNEASGVNSRVVSATIIGVAPRGFFGVDVDRDSDLWVALTPHREATGYFSATDPMVVRVMARLRPGVPLAAAQAEVDVVAADLVDTTSPPSRASTFFRVEESPRGYSNLRHELRGALYALIAAVGLTLMIVCANIATLLLRRGAIRRREIALRLALGSGGLGIVRLLLSEALLLTIPGALFGLLLAQWAVRGLAAYLPAGTSLAVRIGLDAPALQFALATTVCSAAVFALVPAVRTLQTVELAPLLRDTAIRRTRSRTPLREAAVVVQVALSFVLLVGAGLFLGTLRNLRAVETGFDQRNVVQFSIDVSSENTFESVGRLMDSGLSALEALPGVQSATVYFRTGLLSGDIRVTQLQAANDESQRGVLSNVTSIYVGPRFFETTGVGLIFGPGLDAYRDRSDVVVLSERLALDLFGEEDVVGRSVRWGKGLGSVGEIVGVAENVTHRSLQTPDERAIYFPAPTRSLLPGLSQFAVRAEGDVSGIEVAIQNAIRAIDDDFRATGIQTFYAVREASIARERFVARLVSGFSLIALLLASLGVYGVLSYSVSIRAHEIGIRMAMGAGPRDVIRLVMRDTIWVVLPGLLIGLGVSIAFTRTVTSLLYGLSPLDPLVMLLSACVLTGAAGIASYAPAKRSAALDPLAALRGE